MLSLNEIKAFYPPTLHAKASFLLREYLQCQILNIIYADPLGRHLIFLGGSCLRLVHNNARFSEDLDFDNRGLTAEAFDDVAELVRVGLERMGYAVKIDVVKKGAYHCYVKLPGLLFQEGLSGHVEEKVLISLDAEPQDYDYAPEIARMDRFDTFFNLLSTPLPLLLSQKCLAILERRRNKGRDFFDVAFLLASYALEPDMGYLEKRRGIKTKAELAHALIDRCATVDMDLMLKDVEPFMFKDELGGRVTEFVPIIRGKWLR